MVLCHGTTDGSSELAPRDCRPALSAQSPDARRIGTGSATIPTSETGAAEPALQKMTLPRCGPSTSASHHRNPSAESPLLPKADGFRIFHINFNMMPLLAAYNLPVFAITPASNHFLPCISIETAPPSHALALFSRGKYAGYRRNGTTERRAIARICRVFTLAH